VAPGTSSGEVDQHAAVEGQFLHELRLDRHAGRHSTTSCIPGFGTVRRFELMTDVNLARHDPLACAASRASAS
jgi:hypothetical protein